MAINHRLPAGFLVAAIVLAIAGCSSSGATVAGATASGPATSAAPATSDTGGSGADPYANVDVCGLATADEISAVMGVATHAPFASGMGPGASIDGAYGCTWPLGDSIDLFDLWIYPAASMDLTSAMKTFWDGYTIEPLSGYGDEAVAAVWRGDPAIRTVGQVAGVGVRQGDKVVLMSTLLIGTDYTDPKPAAALAVKVLGRF
jgi:hypothetical protein